MLLTSVRDTRNGGDGFARRHQQALVERQADLARTIQHREDLFLQAQRDIAVTGADAPCKAFFRFTQLRTHLRAKRVTQAFYTLRADGLEYQRLGRFHTAVPRDQAVKG